MNDLQKLLKLKNVSVLQLSEEIGVGYHTTQKVVKGLRTHLPTEEAIAAWFGVSRDQLFGPQASRYLTRSMEQAIRDRTERVADRLRGRYLPHRSVMESTGRRNVKTSI